MHKKEFVKHQLEKRGRKFDPQDKHPEIKSDDSDSEIDESMLSDSYYPEVSDFLPDNSNKKKKPKGTDEEIQKKKSKIRVDREDAFIHKYKTFMGLVEENHSYEWKFLLDDMILLINLLCSKWLWKYSQRKKSVGYQRGDDQEARDFASLAVYKELLAQYESGSYEQYSSNDYRHALAYFQCLFHRRVIDVYRTLYGRMPDPTKLEKQNIATATNEAQRRFAEKNWTLSIEAITADEDNVSHLDRFEKFSWNPYEADTPREIRDTQNERLLMIYYQQLMTYDTKPQRALAVMYARVIFQQARARNPEYDVLWEGSWDVDRHPELIDKAIASTRLSSIPWATEKMGNQTLRELGMESEAILQTWVHPGLYWGKNFHSYLPKTADYPLILSDGNDVVTQEQTWGDLIFTETFCVGEYEEKKVFSHWVTDTHDTILCQIVKVLKDYPDLRQFAVEELSPKNPLRMKLDGTKKGKGVKK